MAKRGRSKGTYQQAARLLRLLELLRSAPYGKLIGELAEALQVSERQVWRDLAALERGGTELERRADGHQRRVVLKPVRKGHVELSLRQRFVLLAARRAFDLLEGTPFAEDIETIYARVLDSLPVEGRERMDGRVTGRIVFLPDAGPKRYAGCADVIDGLLTGLLHCWRVAVRYTRADGAAFRGLLEPYAMVVYRQGLYILGSTVRRRRSGELVRQAPRVYAVERFARADHRREEPFERPADFDVDRYFDGVFGLFGGGEAVEEVVVRFSPAARTLVEARQWHPSQRLTYEDDGAVRLSMRVVNTTAVVPWLLGWGPLARVEAPAGLVARVQEELRAASEGYTAPLPHAHPPSSPEGAPASSTPSARPHTAPAPVAAPEPDPT